ncbi:MAG: glycosyl transferase family protein [Sphingomonadaceae bacterium]
MEAGAIAAIEFAAHELALLAAAGFLLFGIDDLAVDLIFLARRAWRRRGSGEDAPRSVGDLPVAERPGRIAVFVPAWDEGEVIGEMIARCLERYGPAGAAHDYLLYVGCYPNDAGTREALAGIADPRLRTVLLPHLGPTTKADCLNHLWRALVGDERREGFTAKAVLLHDAEDIVSSAELAIVDSLIERHALVQLPVLPLIDPRSRWVSGHYADEFAEAHGKDLVVRQAIGAALPSAGVGCAISRAALGRLAENSGHPFDADCLTEDYELGLRLAALGQSQAFVRLPLAPGGGIAATREYFPRSVEAAVAQKSRWIAGIALAGWDRLGWRGGIAERWMRLRDRKALLTAIFIVAGYAALLLWLLLALLGSPPALTPLLSALLLVNAALLGWRFAVRAAFTGRAHGWREALYSVPRLFVANFIAVLATRRAFVRYLAARRSGVTRWEKTVHRFPRELPAE